MRERERIETALRQSRKMEAIGQFSGGIAHDFNNLLMIIKGNLGFLRNKKALDPERAARHLAAAMEGADRALALTRRILAFSRKQPLYPVRFDLNDLIRSLEDLIRNSVGETVNGKQDLAATWPVVCDKNQMESVVLNLVLNARDAMPSGGRLTIRTRDTHLDDESANSQELAGGDYVALSVSDNGSGMPEEVRMRALDPFFTTKPVGHGTGLGLSTAFGFVRQSGGAMRIESDPGRGTTVTVFAPRQRRGHGRGRGTKGGEAVVMARILAVEDEALVRTLIVQTLEGAGHVVLEAHDGAAALSIVEADPDFDVIVTDIRMPRVGGYELARAARRILPKAGFVFMTGYSKEDVPRELSTSRLLQKPFDPERLIAIVNSLTDGRQARD